MDRVKANGLCLILAAGLRAIALSVYLGGRAVAEPIRRGDPAGRRVAGELSARDFASPSDSPDRVP